MPRILTAECEKATIKNLKDVAAGNMRSAGKEALIAIEAHIEANRHHLKQGPSQRRKK